MKKWVVWEKLVGSLWDGGITTLLAMTSVTTLVGAFLMLIWWCVQSKWFSGTNQTQSLNENNTKNNESRLVIQFLSQGVKIMLAILLNIIKNMFFFLSFSGIYNKNMEIMPDFMILFSDKLRMICQIELKPFSYYLWKWHKEVIKQWQ